MVQGRVGDADYVPWNRPIQAHQQACQWHGGALQQLRWRQQLRRSRRAPALWRCGEVQLDRLAAGTRAGLGGEFSGAELKDQRRDLLGAVDADPGAEQPAARAVATRLVRCQSEALAHHAFTLASGAAAAAFMMRPTTMPSASTS